MAERIRNFFRFNILPVLPYLRKKNRGTAAHDLAAEIEAVPVRVITVEDEAVGFGSGDLRLCLRNRARAVGLPLVRRESTA